MTKPNDEQLDAVDTALMVWRQGDCVLGEQWFVFRRDALVTSTQSSGSEQTEDSGLDESQEQGFVVLTQSCDIVRTWKERPYIEISPLVEVGQQELYPIERGRRPNYAYIPGVANQHLVADLDRVMTVEKPIVAKWIRTVGCNNDSERRAFAEALTRKRARFAFPDDFTHLAQRLKDRLQEKHDKRSPEGEALRSLRQIRVRAAPSWDAPEVELTFLFIRGEGAVVAAIDEWLKLVPNSGRYKVQGFLTTLDDLTARDYVESDPLDLDHLSSHS